MSLRKILMRKLQGIEVLALPAGPKVLLLMPYVQLPGTKFVIPKDDIAKNYTKVVQF
jgi:hypothetical protein